MRTWLLALSLLVVAPLACSGAPPLGSATPPASTPDIEATVRAAVQAALPTPVAVDPPDLAATVIVSVQATVEAMFSATPVPAPAPAAVPTETATSIPVPTPTAVAISSPTAMLTEAASPAPTPAPSPVSAPTATPIPRPTAVPVSRFISVPVPVPSLTPTPTATPVPAPTPTAPLLPPGGCQPAADGALVTAWVEGVQAASATVQDGSYVLFVDQGSGSSYIGKTVNFRVGDLDAKETGIWEIGGGDGIDLTATMQLSPDPSLAPSTSLPRAHLSGGLLAQAVPPHVFLGTASICGAATPAPTPLPAVGCQPAADGALVTAWAGGILAASSTVQDGRYILFIDQAAGETFTGKTVTFKIGDLNANETGIWEAGGGDDLDLTSAPWRMPEPTPEPYGLLPRWGLSSGVLAQPVPPHVFLGKASVCG